MNSIKIIVALTISAITLTGHGQSLNLTYADGNTSLPLASSSSVTIDPVTGDINLTTTDTAENIGTSLGLQPVGDIPDISFNVTPNGTTSATINATIVNDAVYCQKTGLWAGYTTNNPPTNFVTVVSEVVTSNGSNYNLTCANSFGQSTTNATVSNITTVITPSVTINTDPTSVDSGGNSTLTWSVVNAPVSCTFTGDWPTVTKDGPFSFPINSITSNKTYNVSCTNSAGTSAMATASITVNGAGSNSWPSCAGAAASVLNGAEDRHILANGTTNHSTYTGVYEELQGNGIINPWPGTWGDLVRLSIDKNKYVAAQFTTDGTNYDAKLNFFGASNFEGPNPQRKTITISECPGDFNIHVNQTRCRINSNTLYWSTKSTSNPALFCKLQKNTTYYLNIIHSDNQDVNGSPENNNYATSDCIAGAGYCGALFSQTSVD